MLSSFIQTIDRITVQLQSKFIHPPIYSSFHSVNVFSRAAWTAAVVIMSRFLCIYMSSQMGVRNVIPAIMKSIPYIGQKQNELLFPSCWEKKVLQLHVYNSKMISTDRKINSCTRSTDQNLDKQINTSDRLRSSYQNELTS